ncbi:MAG: metallophosphoesterase [Lachnotalea sp.]
MLKYILITVIIMAFIMMIYIAHENRVFTITRYKINSNKLTGLNETIKIIVLADLHNHIYGSDNETLIKAIEEENPDLILVAGDLLVAKPGKEIHTATSLMKRLSLKFPIYYGIGNHEYRLKIYPEQYKDMCERYFGELKKCGVHILDNKYEKIQIKNTVLNIYGIEIDKEYYKRMVSTEMTSQYIESLLGRLNEQEYNILLAHNPNYFKTYAKWGADLTLSGHIHGGLVRLPIFGGVVSPQVEFFPEYDSGLFQESGKQMVLSRGLGTHTINVRINNRAELVCIELGSKESNI